jgi:hypothetical protein
MTPPPPPIIPEPDSGGGMTRRQLTNLTIGASILAACLFVLFNIYSGVIHALIEKYLLP